MQGLLEKATAPEDSELPIPNILTVFAHPDDETLALGARLGRLRSAHFVHVTDGAPRNQADSRNHGFTSLEAYREARRNEFRHVLGMAGIADTRCECLGVADQEASLELVALTGRVLEVLEKHRPEVIFTHPYEGGHPDHDACAFAVHHAAGLFTKRFNQLAAIVEAPFYHAGQNGMVTGVFLPGDHETCEAAYALSTQERERKAALLNCFRTQRQVLQYFAIKSERFRLAPRYDFREPPHAGTVFYDQFPWGMSSRRFCELARKAERDLERSAVAA